MLPKKKTPKPRKRAKRNASPTLGQAVERCARILRSADARAERARSCAAAHVELAERRSRASTVRQLRELLEALADDERRSAVGALELLGLKLPEGAAP